VEFSRSRDRPRPRGGKPHATRHGACEIKRVQPAEHAPAGSDSRLARQRARHRAERARKTKQPPEHREPAVEAPPFPPKPDAPRKAVSPERMPRPEAARSETGSTPSWHQARGRSRSNGNTRVPPRPRPMRRWRNDSTQKPTRPPPAGSRQCAGVSFSRKENTPRRAHSASLPLDNTPCVFYVLAEAHETTRAHR